SGTRTFTRPTSIVWCEEESRFQTPTPLVQFALRRAIRSGPDASRQPPVSSVMQKRLRRRAKPRKWKRVVDHIWAERCRASNTGLLESENFTRLRGMKISVTKRYGAAKKLTIRHSEQAMITARGWRGSVRSSISWRHRCAYA